MGAPFKFHWFPVEELELSVFPICVIMGVAGFGFTFTVVGAEVATQALVFVTVTE
jgi:hypothetical protein